MPIERALALTLFAVAVDVGQRAAGLGVRAGDLLDEDRAADAAATGGVERVLDRDVVVGDDRRDLDLALDELGGHLEVEDVAGVVLDDVEDAGATVDGPGRGLHLVRDRRREDVAGTGRVEHAEADEAAVQRFVAGAAAGDQGDLARDRTAGPEDDEHVGGVDPDESGWARPRPARLSGTRSSTSLMSFFIGQDPFSLDGAGQAAAAAGLLAADELVEEGAEDATDGRAEDVHDDQLVDRDGRRRRRPVRGGPGRARGRGSGRPR